MTSGVPGPRSKWSLRETSWNDLMVNTLSANWLMDATMRRPYFRFHGDRDRSSFGPGRTGPAGTSILQAKLVIRIGDSGLNGSIRDGL